MKDGPGQAYALLPHLAKLGPHLLTFTALPVGPTRTQVALFPEDATRMADRSRGASLDLEGPHLAIPVRGDDELGALAGIH